MTDFFSDTFTQPANGPITAHTSDSGATYVQVVGTEVPTTFTSFGGIVASGGTGKALVRSSVIAPYADVVALANLYYDTSLAGDTFTCGIAIRVNASGTSGYLAAYNRATFVWEIYSLGNSGAVTLLASSNSAAFTIVDGTSYPIEFSAIGNVLKLKVLGNTLITTTDNSVSAAGYPAFWFNGTHMTASNMFINSMSASASAGSADVTAPEISSAVVSNSAPTKVDISFNEALAASTAPASAFAVSGHTVTAASSPSGSGIQLTVSPAVTNGESLALGYVQPASNPRLQDAAANPVATVSGYAVTNNVGAVANVISGTSLYSKLIFSPGNWEVTSSKAKTFHPGAYLLMIFSGVSCVLNFDMSSGYNPVAQISYRVDGCGPWFKTEISAALSITIPSNVANSGRHYLEVDVKVAGGVNCWTTDAGAVILTSVTLANGGALYLPLTTMNKNGMFFGDSITNGDLTVQGTANDAADAQAGWAFQIGKLLNSNFGISAFGSTKWIGAGGGNTGIPGLVDSWNLKSYGVARDFGALALDYIVINMGTNDTVDVTSAVTQTLNGMIAATASTCKIIVMRPFNGSHAAQIVAGIAACSTPARVYYLDTTGFLNSAFVDGSGLHPLAFENVSHIVPQVFPLIAGALGGSPTLAARTVTVTLGTDASTPAANLTGLKVSYFDEATPDLHTVARYKTASGTTSASGVLSFTAQSTLAAGGTGYLVVQGAAGVHYNAPVVVA